MKLRIVLTTVVALAVLGAIFGYKIITVRQQMAAMAAQVRPPTTVSAAPAQPETWGETVGAVATLESFRGITVSSEVAGTVRRVAFESGATVRGGDVLVELDTSTEEAQLDGLVAAERLAATNLTRARELRTNGTNTQSDLDNAEALDAEARASVKQLRAQIAKKRITAAFDGRLGITQVYPGQYVQPGAPLVILEATDPIYADFGLPQQQIARVLPGQTVRVSVDAFPGREFTGRVEAVNPRVTDATRNVRIRAALPNADGALRPGMFGRVTVDLPAKQDVLVVPATAIVYSTYGDSVYVVAEQAAQAGTPVAPIAQQRFITVGPTRGDLVAITKGLQPGEQVVTSGQIKLRNGAPVRIDNRVTPSTDAAPTPDES